MVSGRYNYTWLMGHKFINKLMTRGAPSCRSDCRFQDWITRIERHIKSDIHLCGRSKGFNNSELSSLHVLPLKAALLKLEISIAFIALTFLSFHGPSQHIVLSQPADCFTKIKGSIQSDSGPFVPAVYMSEQLVAHGVCVKHVGTFLCSQKVFYFFAGSRTVQDFWI